MRPHPLTDIRPVGERAFLLELPDNASVHAAATAARQRFGAALADVVPGHLTLLLVSADDNARPTPGDLERLMSDPRALVELPSALGSEMERLEDSQAEAVTVHISYDGADLKAVAQQLGVSVREVVELHSGAVYTVAFMGFAPGFPYLISSDPEVQALLALPRLATPRTEVPAGSVAVAAGYCGIYPRSSPGGWNLLGHTDAVLFDAAREPPALLAPGTRVRFEAIR